MKRLFALAAVGMFSAVSNAQIQNGANFCNEGLVPDGYIDFSDMPPAPTFPAGGNSAPFTATLPVHGVSGLTVQVIIPALQPNDAHASSGGPIYQKYPGAISFNGNSDAGLQLQFSTGVQGVASSNSKYDRGVNFSLGIGPTNDQGPTTFRNSISNFTMYPSFPEFSLQMVDRFGTFQSAFISFPGNIDYGDGLTLSNVRVQSAHAAADREAAVPTKGLAMWLRSDDIAGGPGPGAGPAVWPDHSGAGHSATPAASTGGLGGISLNGTACQPAYSFNGGHFDFNLPIDGWTQMTVFLVSASAADTNNGASRNAAIFWNENASWGNTFVSPYQTHAAFRFGTTQVGNQPVYARPVDVGNDLTVTRAVHNQTTDSLYVDGQLVLTQAGKYASLNGTTGAGVLGLGLDGTPFEGQISEVLVYNRVLTEAESTTVEKYLRTKFRTE